jgi:hypothetical protein
MLCRHDHAIRIDTEPRAREAERRTALHFRVMTSYVDKGSLIHEAQGAPNA